MPKFSEKSKAHLNTCEIRLQMLFNEVIRHVDCAILCGHRNEADQNAAFDSGNSKLEWPHSKHNAFPSEAVDAMPYPIDWNDTKRIYIFVGFVKATALSLGINIRCGADWDGDFDLKDQKFVDLPHFELID